MMNEKKSSGLKSSWELALERLDGKAGPPAAMSDEQKKALADIDRQAQARIAEIEILVGPKIAAARAGGDAEELKKLEEQKTADLARVRDRAERDKEAVRQGKS